MGIQLINLKKNLCLYSPIGACLVISLVMSSYHTLLSKSKIKKKKKKLKNKIKKNEKNKIKEK